MFDIESDSTAVRLLFKVINKKQNKTNKQTNKKSSITTFFNTMVYERHM